MKVIFFTKYFQQYKEGIFFNNNYNAYNLYVKCLPDSKLLVIIVLLILSFRTSYRSKGLVKDIKFCY